MVGINGGAKEFRRILIKLANASNSGLDYWEEKSIRELEAWKDAFAEEDEDG